MKKRNILCNGMLALAAMLLFSQCDNKKDAEPVVAVKSGTLKIAYIDIDSVSANYQLCKDLNASLTKKSDNAQATLIKKNKDLQSLYQQVQSKVQANALTREQYEAAQHSLQAQQQDLQSLQERLSNELQEEQAKALKEELDSINNFINAYNKSKGYNIILRKEATLYIDKSFDITNDIITGLNKRYKKKATPISSTDKKEKK